MPASDQVLTPPPAFALPALDGVLPGVGAETSEPVTLRTTYFDAPDLRLTRSGAVLVSGPDGFVVRIPDPVSGGTVERRARDDAATPPDALVDLVRSRLRAADPTPVARLRIRRQRVELRRPNGEPLGAVTDDEISVLDGRRVAARFREVHVDVEPDSSDLRAAVVDRLRAAGAGGPGPAPQPVRVFGSRALDPPDLEPVAVRADSPAGDVVRAAVAVAAGRLVAHDPIVRIGEDAEGVHQARVATRRLRSDLRTFRNLLEADWNAALRAELRWIGRELGAVRDADVLLERLTAHAAALAPDDREAAEILFKRLADRREAARGRLLAALRSARYLDLLERLVEASRAPRLVLPGADEPAATALPPVVAGPWRHLRDAIDSLGDPPSDEELHNVRIRAKRARYAAEAVAPAIGKPARRYAKAVAEVQDVLGRHQDAVVAEQWLRNAAEHATGSELFVAGQLAAVERAEARAARAEFPKAWKAARAKRLRDWF